MLHMFFAKTIAVALVGCMTLRLAPQGALAQSGTRTVEPDHDLELFQKRQSRRGDTQFPGDHFSRAFPGDHFTPRQRGMLERQGIRSIGDFVAVDAAVIARMSVMPQRSVIGWQREISGKQR